MTSYVIAQAVLLAAFAVAALHRRRACRLACEDEREAVQAAHWFRTIRTTTT